MDRLEAIQFLMDNCSCNTIRQRLSLLCCIQDVMSATDGAFEMPVEDIKTWLLADLKAAEELNIYYEGR